MERLTELTNALRQSRMRLTPQRIAICEFLAESKQHPTAQAIYAVLRPKFASLSLATVYNTLEVLSSLGAINELGSAGDGAAHYDADVTPHINIACVKCHKVVDLPTIPLGHAEKVVENTSGYRVLGARILYYGLCPECREAELVTLS